MAKRGARLENGLPVEDEVSTPRQALVLTEEEARAVYRFLKHAWFPSNDYDALNGLAKRLRYLEEE